MTTSTPSTPTGDHRGPTVADRAAPRLRLVAAGDRTGRLAGGWWPRSRDLETELADLVDHFPATHGRVARALYSPPDWDRAARRIVIARGSMKIGSFPRDDTHLMQLTLLGGSSVDLLVVPPETDAPTAELLLAEAATPGNTRTAVEVLAAGLRG